MSEVSKFLFALAILVAINDAIHIYCIMNEDGRHVARYVFRCIAICTMCVLLAIILK